MNVVRYRVDGRRYLAVDAANYVPDRTAFAARHCDPETGVRPPEAVAADGGPSTDDRSVRAAERASFDGEGAVASTAGDRSSLARTDGDGGAIDSTNGDCDATDGESVRGADAVLFMAMETEYRPPRVVLTVVRPDGTRVPYSSPAVRCASRWAATELAVDRVMVDTQAGTNEVAVRADGTVVVEPEGLSSPPGEATGRNRGPVVREFATDVSRDP